MGLYSVNCPQCLILHDWFSGNTDQRCSVCISGATNGNNNFTITTTSDTYGLELRVENLESEVKTLKERLSKLEAEVFCAK